MEHRTDPGGSSAGSAAAVSAGLGPVVPGSDGGCSLRVPARVLRTGRLQTVDAPCPGPARLPGRPVPRRLVPGGTVRVSTPRCSMLSQAGGEHRRPLRAPARPSGDISARISAR
ncbi:amidase family protein [Streptomyces sp. NPDC058221]|uniref:amidase family protein n=1 Tax=Streptomyces sp. NPDC058221 TaxID=3346388 RepID=UPI0036EA6B63